MSIADLHVHSRFSFDSCEQPENYVNRAIELGCVVTGFSEHYDYDAIIDSANDVTLCNLDDYTAYISSLKKIAGGHILVLTGIEYGYRAEAVAHYNEKTKQYKFDYIINSLHTIKGKGDCYHDDFFNGCELKESYLQYLLSVLESVKSELDYDIVGHLGYVSRYRKGKDVRLKYSDFPDILDEILSEIAKRNKCLEINTSVGSSGSNFLPDTDIIRRYLQLGGQKLSFGSDAHRVQDYMRSVQQLKSFLIAEGITHLYYYKDRVPVAYNIL